MGFYHFVSWEVISDCDICYSTEKEQKTFY